MTVATWNWRMLPSPPSPIATKRTGTSGPGMLGVLPPEPPAPVDEVVVVAPPLPVTPVEDDACWLALVAPLAPWPPLVWVDEVSPLQAAVVRTSAHAPCHTRIIPDDYAHRRGFAMDVGRLSPPAAARACPRPRRGTPAPPCRSSGSCRRRRHSPDRCSRSSHS